MSSQLRYVLKKSASILMKCPHIQVEPTHTQTHTSQLSQLELSMQLSVEVYSRRMSGILKLLVHIQTSAK